MFLLTSLTPSKLERLVNKWRYRSVPSDRSGEKAARKRWLRRRRDESSPEKEALLEEE
jgi:hypothetical protein